MEPATRAAAILLLCTLLVFHNLQLQPELVSETVAFVTAAIAYGLLSWLPLRHIDDSRAVWDPLVALGDVALAAGAVWCSGGVESLLFFALCARITDQAKLGVGRGLVFVHLTLLSYGLVSWLDVSLRGGDVARAIVQGGLLYVLGLYLAASQRTANGRPWMPGQLVRTRRHPDPAEQAKRRFLAVVGHELRTPLNGMLGMTELLLDTDLDPEQESLAHTARASAQALSCLINDVLDFAKAEAGDIELDRASFDLREIAAEVLRTTAPAAFAGGLSLEWSASADLPHRVLGDAERVRQVLLLVLDNAVKFTPKGGITLHLRHGRGDAIVEMVIEDTGIGVPFTQRDRIFEAFSQADPSSTRRYGGAGLGLAMARSLARRMSGDLVRHSRRGGGSIFVFSARLATAPETTTDDPPLPSARFLVDVRLPKTAAFVQQTLISWGLEPAAGSGSSPDLVVTDGDSTLRGPATILLTPQLSGRSASFSTPPVVHLPLRLAELRRAVERQLCTSGARSVPPSSGSALEVLVVEDNPVNQRVAQKTLERLGHRVTIAATGDEAISRAVTGRFELILMDLQLPDLDGVETTRRIRRHEPTREVPIIALTADASREDRARCLNAGMNDHLSKPLRRNELERALHRWCGARQIARRAVSS